MTIIEPKAHPPLLRLLIKKGIVTERKETEYDDDMVEHVVIPEPDVGETKLMFLRRFVYWFSQWEKFALDTATKYELTKINYSYGLKSSGITLPEVARKSFDKEKLAYKERVFFSLFIDSMSDFRERRIARESPQFTYLNLNLSKSFSKDLDIEEVRAKALKMVKTISPSNSSYILECMVMYYYLFDTIKFEEVLNSEDKLTDCINLKTALRAVIGTMGSDAGLLPDIIQLLVQIEQVLVEASV